jgi:uncharacterized membrane protein
MSGSRRPPTEPTFGRLAAILRIGTVVAVGIVAAGLAWSFVAGAAGVTDRGVLEHIGAGGADALIAIGLIGLVLVPIVALGSAVATFAQAGERRSLGISATVLVLVLASLAAAVAIGTPGS